MNPKFGMLTPLEMAGWCIPSWVTLSLTLTSGLRGTFTYVPTQWIFFKLCILTTHYIQTMKMYLLNKIVKNKA